MGAGLSRSVQPMQPMKSLFCVSMVLWLCPAAFAAAFTPDAAIRHAIAHQPELAAARLLVAEARARFKQAGRLDNPEVETEVRPNTNAREGILALGLTQRFPLTGRLRAERAVSDAGILAAEAELHDAERQLANRTGLAIADWLASTARLELAGHQWTNALMLAGALESAADKGEVSRLDARQLRLEAGQAAVRRRQVEQERAMLQGELRRLLDLPGEEPLSLSGGLPLAMAGSPVPATAETQPHPDIRLALARLEIACRESRLARARRWQDVGVGLVGEHQRSEDQPVGVRRDDFLGVRVTLPLPVWNRNQGHIHETESRVERRRLELQAVQLRIRTGQDAARETFALAAATERDWREQLLPSARELEEEVRQLREQGQAGVTDWARARERRLQAEAAHLEARRDLLRAWLLAQAAFGQFPQFPALP